MRGGLGDGFDFSVTVAGDERGEALGLTLRRWVSLLGGGTVTVRPGVVTVSEELVVVVVVVVCCS